MFGDVVGHWVILVRNFQFQRLIAPSARFLLQKDTSGRLVRYREELAEFNVSYRCIKGEDNVSDIFSRFIDVVVGQCCG